MICLLACVILISCTGVLGEYFHVGGDIITFGHTCSGRQRYKCDVQPVRIIIFFAKQILQQLNVEIYALFHE